MAWLGKIIIRYVVSILSCIYLLTLGIFSSRNRDLLYKVRIHLGLAKPPPLSEIKPPPIIPCLDIDNILDTDLEIKVLGTEVIAGNVSILETVVINKFIRHYDPKMCFEIGTFDGRTTLNIAANSSPEARVFTLDLHKNDLDSTQLGLHPGDLYYIKKEIAGSRFHNTGHASKITQMYGDSATFDFSRFVNKMDLVFIDGSHSYEYVINDTNTAFRLLRDGVGIILWHDYDSPTWVGVTRALNEMYKTGGRCKFLRWIKGTSLVCLISNKSAPDNTFHEI